MIVKMKCYSSVLLFHCSIDCDKSYEVESGEITSPLYTSLNSGWIFCLYTIKVPEGRRITVEIIKGKSLCQACEKMFQPENYFQDKLIVSIIINYSNAI